MAKILIAYASRTGNTGAIANLIAEGIRISGHEAQVVNANEIKSEDKIKGYDAYIFGSPTYHGEMLTPMKQMLFIAERAELEGKPGGSFGAFGWSGEAAPRIFETMEYIFKMKMNSGGPLMLKAASLEGAIPSAHEYGKKMAAMV